MTTDIPEIEVLKVLQRTVKAIRRGDNLKLVDPATKWEKQFAEQIAQLEGGDDHSETVPHAA